MTAATTSTAGRPDRYSTGSVILHWLIAALVLVQILLVSAADATEGSQAREYIGLHKAAGLSILMLTLVRLGWRLAHPVAPLPSQTPAWQVWAARIVHVLFYALLIGLPLGGWAASSAGGRDIDYFGLFEWPLLPLPLDRELAGTFMDAHRAGVKLLYVLIGLHILGALKHAFTDGDDTLRRILPFLPRKP